MASSIPLKLTPRILLALAVLLFGVGLGLGKYLGGRSLEGFSTCASSKPSVPTCSVCSKTDDKCSCQQKTASRLMCPPCRAPDLSKYVLKASIPPPVTCPDMSNYMLKTECPPVADLSKYVLKASIPKQQPIIIDNSACQKSAGECPPCPRARCPEVKCPAPTVCPAPAPCPRQVCPTATLKCKSENVPADTVRPFLAPLNMGTFGMGM